MAKGKKLEASNVVAVTKRIDQIRNLVAVAEYGYSRALACCWNTRS